MANIALFSQIVSKLDRGGFSKRDKKRDTEASKRLYQLDAPDRDTFQPVCRQPVGSGYQPRAPLSYREPEHLGIERTPSKSTISYQNARRGWRLFRDYYHHLLNYLGQQANSPAEEEIQGFCFKNREK